MKRLMTFILLTVIITSCRQTAQEYFDNGIEKQNKQEFKEALSDYSKAIELKKTFIEAYYNRALVYLNMDKHKEAMSDLDKVIEMNDKFPNALITRGLIHVVLEDKEACCKDFQRAKEIGDTAANRLLAQYCGNKQQTKESFVLNWPEYENWKIAGRQENNEMIFVELLKNDETFDNWTEIGTMMSIKGATNIPMDNAMNMMFEQAQKEGKDSKLTFIKKDESCEFPWILFKIETSKHKKGDKGPESQLWYIVQGKTSLYTNFRAVKEKEISKELETKWIVFFKAGKVVYKNN